MNPKSTRAVGTEGSPISSGSDTCGTDRANESCTTEQMIRELQRAYEETECLYPSPLSPPTLFPEASGQQQQLFAPYDPMPAFQPPPFCAGTMVYDVGFPALVADTTRREKKDLYVCDICFRPFKRASDMTRHQRTVHCKHDLKCDVCHGRYTRFDTLRRHIRKKHPNVAAELLANRMPGMVAQQGGGAMGVLNVGMEGVLNIVGSSSNPEAR